MLLNKSCESMKANENYPKKLSIYIECKGVQFEKCSGSFYCKSTIINNYLPPPHHPMAKVDPCFLGSINWGSTVFFSHLLHRENITTDALTRTIYKYILKYIGHLCSKIYTGLETRSVRKLLLLYCWQFRGIKCWQHITDIKDIFFTKYIALLL